jgi:hypothetical protein
MRSINLSRNWRAVADFASDLKYKLKYLIKSFRPMLQHFSSLVVLTTGEDIFC